MNFYRRDPGDQRRLAFTALTRYLREVVGPYHPEFRRRLRAAGIDPRAIRTPEDFARIPVVSKEEYRPDPRAFILQPRFPGGPSVAAYDTAEIARTALLRYIWEAVLDRPPDPAALFRRMSFREKVARRAALEWLPVHFHASAGSTGDPTPAVYTPWELRTILPELAAAVFIRGKGGRGVEFTQRNMNLFPGAPHLAFFQAVFTKLLAGLSSFDTCGGKVLPTERQIDLFARGGFEGLNAVPSYCVHWFRKAAEMQKEGRIGPLAALKLAVVAAEPVTDGLRTTLHDLARELGASPEFRIVAGYGSTELKWAFCECDEGTQVHLNPRYWWWEVLDPETRRPVPEGAPGVLTFSHIGWRGTVFVRYFTGDLVQGLRWERCPACGLSFVKLLGPISRWGRDFVKVKGTRIPLQELIGAVRDTPGVRTFQVLFDKEREGDPYSRDLLTIRLAVEPGRPFEEVAEAVRAHVRGALEITPDRLIHEADPAAIDKDLFARTGIKADYVRDLRPKP